MEFDLTPREKTIMIARNRIAIGALVFTAVLWVATFLSGFVVRNVETVFILTSLFIAIDILLSYPSLRYGKISRSVVKFTSAGIQFIDTKRRCWRWVPYNDITKIQKRTIMGTFYGEKKNEVEGEYLCFFLHGSNEIPDVSFAKLFKHKDFAMIYYQEGMVEKTGLCLDD